MRGVAMIIGIWAEDEAGLIGEADKMPWSLPAEQQHFKETTMTKSIFGLFTALLCWISIVIAIQCFRKKRWGLGVLFLLNAFTNLVNTIHAFSGTLF